MFLSKTQKIVSVKTVKLIFFLESHKIIFSIKTINYVFTSQPQNYNFFVKIFIIFFVPKWQNLVFRQNLKMKLFLFFKPQINFFTKTDIFFPAKIHVLVFLWNQKNSCSCFLKSILIKWTNRSYRERPHRFRNPLRK